MNIIGIILILFAAALFLAIGYFVGRKFSEHKFEGILPKIREDAIQRSRSVLGGQFSEQLAPYLPNFPFSPAECRFIGKPVDLIVFSGMDEKKISEVVFVEVKSGKAGLNSQEKNLKNAILAKNVRWEEYRVPDEVTKGRKPAED
jgi:predicted Holliday junction resolvase-like endonuclease